MTQVQYSENPNWALLENMIGPDRCGRFDFIGFVEVFDTTIYLYKHKDTRRYINVDLKGNTWLFKLNDSRPRVGVYVPLPKEEAVQRVFK